MRGKYTVSCNYKDNIKFLFFLQIQYAKICLEVCNIKLSNSHGSLLQLSHIFLHWFYLSHIFLFSSKYNPSFLVETGIIFQYD